MCRPTIENSPELESVLAYMSTNYWRDNVVRFKWGLHNARSNLDQRTSPKEKWECHITIVRSCLSKSNERKTEILSSNSLKLVRVETEQARVGAAHYY